MSPLSAVELVGSSLAEQPFFGVYLFQDGRFVYVNERFAEILGYAVVEVMALPDVLDTVYEGDREMVRENIRSRLDGEVEQLRYSLRGRRKDGSPVDLEVQSRRVMHDGRPAVVGVQCDVSEREREGRNYHTRQKAEALGVMAAGIVHDFNNILTAIGTTAELIALEVKGQAAKDATEIRDAVERGRRLCQRLMAFGSPGRREDASASVGEVLAGLAPILKRLLSSREIRLAVHVAESLPRVQIGSAAVEQVLMNLVVNAGDASPEGQMVEVAATVGDSAEERRVRVDVRDHGAGIEPAHLERIFEPYFTTKGDKGNGLGLRNVSRIVTSSGGEVHVESEPGRGSTFSVFLPIERRQAQRSTHAFSLQHDWTRRAGPPPSQEESGGRSMER